MRWEYFILDVPECTANALVTAVQAIGSHNTNHLKLKFTDYLGSLSVHDVFARNRVTCELSVIRTKKK